MAPPSSTRAPPPLGRCRHTPGQRDAGRLLPCALPRESVSGNFFRRHVLGAITTTTTYHTIPYHTVPYHLAESPPANPRFFLEGAHEPRGRHRVFTAKPDGAPTGDPPPPHGWVHTTSAAPPPPPQPPQKGTPARRVGDIVPCRAAMNRHGPTPGDTRPPPPPPRSRGAPVVPRAGSNPPPPPAMERPPSGALAQPPGASRDLAPSQHSPPAPPPQPQP